jgi:hypothetical protein
MEYRNHQRQQDQFDNRDQMDKEPADKEMDSEPEMTEDEWEYKVQLEKGKLTFKIL